MSSHIKEYTVAYVTSSRADYGIVRNYLKLLNNDSNINLSILVTGTHLSNDFNMSVNDIEKDNFKIALRVKYSINSFDTAAILKNMAICLEEFGSHFMKNKYDLLIVLGDRYEILMASIAAAMQGIKILHLHGGELTFGNYDEFIRHSITKMSKFHFTSTPEYQKRVIQLGENPKNVFYMGALGAENCLNINRDNVYDNILELSNKKYFVILFHPETLTNSNLKYQLSQLILALSQYSNKFDFVFIGSNADTNSNIIKETWIDYVKINKNTLYIENLNSDSFLYLIKNAQLLIGNSSSGIIEAPTLGTYTINIGERQNGRIRASSVLDTKCRSEDISKSISNALIMKEKRQTIYNPYYKKNAAKNYYSKTKDILLLNCTNVKEFYDINI